MIFTSTTIMIVARTMHGISESNNGVIIVVVSSGCGNNSMQFLSF